MGVTDLAREEPFAERLGAPFYGQPPQGLSQQEMSNEFVSKKKTLAIDKTETRLVTCRHKRRKTVGSNSEGLVQ